MEGGLQSLHGAETHVVSTFSESLGALREAVADLQRQYAAEQRRLHDLHSWATEAEEEGVASGRGEEEKGQPVARGLEMEMAAV